MKLAVLVALVLVWLLIVISYAMCASHKQADRMYFGWVRFRFHCLLANTILVIVWFLL